MCLRALVGVFYACTVADAALRPKASQIVGFLEKVLERKPVEKAEMEEEVAQLGVVDSEPGLGAVGENSSEHEEVADEESFAGQAPEEAVVQCGPQKEEAIKVPSGDEDVIELLDGAAELFEILDEHTP